MKRGLVGVSSDAPMHKLNLAIPGIPAQTCTLTGGEFYQDVKAMTQIGNVKSKTRLLIIKDCTVNSRSRLKFSASTSVAKAQGIPACRTRTNRSGPANPEAVSKAPISTGMATILIRTAFSGS